MQMRQTPTIEPASCDVPALVRALIAGGRCESEVFNTSLPQSYGSIIEKSSILHSLKVTGV
jgi:hypothetical protein